MSTIDFVAGWLALLYTQSIAGNVVGTILSKRGLLVYGHGISTPNVKSDIYMEYSRWLVIILAPILPELLNPRQGRDGEHRASKYPSSLYSLRYHATESIHLLEASTSSVNSRRQAHLHFKSVRSSNRGFRGDTYLLICFTVARQLFCVSVLG